jgi:DNA-directed RNA polymerase specialized sigma24 family protein
VTVKSLDAAVGHLLRELAPQVLGAVARRHGDFDAAEDAVQEALIAAADAVARRKASPGIRAAGSTRSPCGA